MEDIFSRFGDLFGGGGFGGFDFGGFGGGGGGGRQVLRGSDLRARVRLTLEEIDAMPMEEANRIIEPLTEGDATRP